MILVPIPATGKQLGSDSATSKSGLSRFGSGSLKIHIEALALVPASCPCFFSQ